MLHLYNYYRSSASFRVRIALYLKKIPFKDIEVHLVKDGGKQNSEDFEKLNPQKLVPVLKHGKKVITQSLAIIDYLEDISKKTPLYSKSKEKRAFEKSFALSIACELSPLNNLKVLNYLTKEFKISDSLKNDWYHHWVKETFTALEKLVSEESTRFCSGDKPTVADICLVPQIYNARRFECNLDDYPNLVRIDKNCRFLEAVQKAWPKDI